MAFAPSNATAHMGVRANLDEEWIARPVDVLRRALASGVHGRAAGDDGAGGALRPAAVLVPLVKHGDGLTVLLTQRTDHLHHHPGQISFPGGRVEDGDESALETALRETEEEIGLLRSSIEVLGELPEYRTVTGFAITPIVGVVAPPLELRLDDFEVASVFEVPLAFLLDARNEERHRIEYRGVLREYSAMPYRGRFIWGATAGMLVSLRELVARTTARGGEA